MDVAKIRELRLAQPFRPFYLVLDSGDRLLVDVAHHLGLAPDGSRLGVATKDGVKLLWPDRVKEIDVIPATSEQ